MEVLPGQTTTEIMLKMCLDFFLQPLEKMFSGYKALTFRKVNSILLSASRLRRGLDIAVAVAPVVVAAAVVAVAVVVVVVAAAIVVEVVVLIKAVVIIEEVVEVVVGGGVGGVGVGVGVAVGVGVGVGVGVVVVVVGVGVGVGVGVVVVVAVAVAVAVAVSTTHHNIKISWPISFVHKTIRQISWLARLGLSVSFVTELDLKVTLR